MWHQVVVQSLSSVQLFVTPWNAAYRACLSLTVSQSLLKLMSIESVMPFNHLILCLPLLLLPSILPRIRVFPMSWLFVSSKEQASFHFMASVMICSDLKPKKIKVCHSFSFSPFICLEVMGLDAMILVFCMLSYKPAFHSPLLPSSRGSLAPLCFLPLGWSYLYI